MDDELIAEPLRSDHHVDWFDCGDDRLSKWLSNQALKDHNLGRSKTFVWIKEELVVGYFTLLQARVSELVDGRPSVKHLLPKGYPGSEPVPAILLAKLAVDKSIQGQGRSVELLADALITAYEAASLIGGVFFLVDPAEGKDWLLEFYKKAGFQKVSGTGRMYMTLPHS